MTKEVSPWDVECAGDIESIDPQLTRKAASKMLSRSADEGSFSKVQEH